MKTRENSISGIVVFHSLSQGRKLNKLLQITFDRSLAVFPKLTEGRGMGWEEEGHFIKVNGNTRY